MEHLAGLFPWPRVSATIVWEIVQLLDKLEYVIGQRFQRFGRL